MKKPTIIAAAIALAAIAGWSALWFTGRGAVTERLDREIAQLKAQGIEITHGGREIGGFPFGYQVTHRDVTLREPSSGAAYRLPDITTEVTAADVDKLVSRFPEKFSIEVPMDEALRTEWPGMPEVLTIDVESTDLVVTSNGIPGDGQEIAITAAALLVVTGSPDQPINFAVEFQALDTMSTLPRLSSGEPVASATTVDRLEYAYTTSTPHGIAVNIEGSVSKLRLTGSSDVRDQAAMLALLAGAGSSSMTYQTGASEGLVRVGTTPEDQEGSLKFEAGSTAGTLSFVNGIFELASASKANRLAVTTGPDTPTAKPFGGELRAVEMHITAPFAPSDTMSPIVLRFALDQVAPDDMFWQLIDAGGKLPHDPAKLVIDIEGDGRITGDLTKHQPGDAPPFEIGKVAIRSANITALGARVATVGDFEFLQPLNQPIGTATITLNKAEEMMVKLADAGLIDPVTVQTVMLMAMGFTAPGTEPGELVSKIVMGADGISVNGQLISGN
jgi:hypothetical protein